MTQIPAGLPPASVPFPPLSTTVAGDPAGPGILLAHGATGSVEGNYGGLLPALSASGHHVVAPDYPGSGDSPRATGPLELDALADAVVAAATGAGLETFTVIGYSMGAAVAVRAAARHPERVRGLVLTAGLARADARTTVWMDLFLHVLERADHAGFAQARALAGLAPERLNSLDARRTGHRIRPGPVPPAERLPRTGRARAHLGHHRQDPWRHRGPTLIIATTLDPLVHPSPLPDTWRTTSPAPRTPRSPPGICPWSSARRSGRA